MKLMHALMQNEDVQCILCIGYVISVHDMSLSHFIGFTNLPTKETGKVNGTELNLIEF